MLDAFKGLMAWGTSRDGITWFCHAVIAVTIGILSEPVFGLWYYWVRESIQVAIRAHKMGVAWVHALKADDALDALFPLWSVSAWVTASQQQWLLFGLVLATIAGAIWILRTYKRG